MLPPGQTFLEKQPTVRNISGSPPEEEKKQDSKEDEENGEGSNDNSKQGLQARRA